MPYQCPNIRIGGVPIIEQNFAWALVPGSHPYVWSFTVPVGSGLNDRLAAVKNPTEIVVEVTGGIDADSQVKTLRIQNLYLLEPKFLDDFNVSWSIADVRWSYRGKKLNFEYNKTRQKNDIKSVVTAGETDPARIRAQFDVFSVGRYVGWSANGGEVAYTVKEILDLELSKLGITLDKSLEDKSYIIENVKMEGVDVYAGIDELLAKSRQSLGIKLDGTLYVYSLDFFDETKITAIEQLGTVHKTGPGKLYRQDLSRVRPSKIKVRFKRLNEVRVIAASSEDIAIGASLEINPDPPLILPDDIRQRKVFGCENVLPVPFPIEFGGTQYNINEYIPIHLYLSILGVPEFDLRRYWFSDQLKYRLTEKLRGGLPATQLVDAQAATIAHTIKQHYRQTYMIDPFIMDRIEQWNTRRVAVVDTYSAFTPPSPVWADFCMVPRRRHPYRAKNLGLWSTYAHNVLVKDNDPARERGTAANLSVVNQELGVFRVVYPPLLDQTIAEIIPSAVDNIPGGLVGTSNSVWAQADLKAQHTMEAMISVIWSVDEKDIFDSDNKYFTFEVDYSAQGGSGPDIEFLSRLEYARYQMRELNTTIVPPEVPLNTGVISAIAQAEGAKLINQHIDRLVGLVKVAGVADIELTGNIQAIIYQFSVGAGLETVVDLRSVPPAPTIEQQVPQEALALLKKQVSSIQHGVAQ